MESLCHHDGLAIVVPVGIVEEQAIHFPRGMSMSQHPSRDAWIYGEDASCELSAEPCDQQYRLVLLGPPGVGKGTQAQLLCNRIGTCHLSTGDLFRACQNIEEPSTAMAAALEAMRRGELVSDELVMSMLRERASCLRCGGGFLLDGIPRTLAQAESLEATLHDLAVDLDAVICYELPLERVVDRLGGRRTCVSCKSVYHVSANPPKDEDTCDHCDDDLMQRDDDHPDAIRVRMQLYTQATQPLMDYYAEQGKLVAVDADGGPEDILERTLDALREHLSLEAI